MSDLKWMIGSDFHFPYQNDRYVKLWFAVMKWFKPHAVDYAGDISDQDCYSRFNAGGTNEFLNMVKDAEETGKLPLVVENETQTKEFYTKTRQMLPNADIKAQLGNHDIRVFDYADKKMPEIVEQITPEALWDFKNLGIEYIHYNDVPMHRFGDIYVHHGIAASKHAGESVRSDIDNLGVSLIRGHSHRMGSYYKTYELRDETVRGYEIGHMADIKSPGMAYTQVHNWQPGFAIAHVESGASTKDGYWPHIQLIHISPDYTCVIDGKKFSA